VAEAAAGAGTNDRRRRQRAAAGVAAKAVPLSVERRLAAILTLDVVGYSRLMGANEEVTHTALQTVWGEVTNPRITKHRGRLVKTMGDGLLVEFASVVDAVRCAFEIQCAMASRNASQPAETRFVFRIGVNLGDIMFDDADIYGDGVNVAARLESLAPEGGICVSRTVYDQVRDKLALSFEDMGERQVKNIARPVHVFRMVLGNSAPAMPGPKAAWRRDTNPAVDNAVLGLCEVLALVFALPFGEDLYKGTPVAAWHYVYLAIGLVFGLVGPAWPHLQSKVPARFSDLFPARLRTGFLVTSGVVAGVMLLFLKISAGPHATPVSPVVGDAIFFDRNKVELSPAAKGSVDQQAEILRANPGVKVTVKTYCSDDEGGRFGRQVLAQLRANQIRDALEAQGIAGGRIKVEAACDGNGPKLPAADEASQAQTRRAVLIRD
jgi:class 3 adenylate cyclase